MKCIAPIRLKVPAPRPSPDDKLTAVQRVSGRARGYTWQDVPCGKCNYCLQDRRADWTFRITQEWKQSKSSYFLTLTYSDNVVPKSPTGQPTLCKEDVQLFMKRLRKENAKCSDYSLRYYLVGEYGTKTKRPHYHIILFNLHPDVRDLVPRIWGLGHVDFGNVSPASIHYTTKYVINRHGDYDAVQKPFLLCPSGPGLDKAMSRHTPNIT